MSADNEPFALQATPSPQRNAQQPQPVKITHKQLALFGKRGLPNQMNLFSDVGTPDSLLPKPPHKGT